MNSQADEFTTDYYSDICYVSSVVADALKQIGDYEASGNDYIHNLFLFIPVAFLNELSLQISDRLVEYVVDTSYYLDDDLSHLIYDASMSDKRRFLKDVRLSIDDTSSTGSFHFDTLKGNLLACLRLCSVVDESAKQSLIGVITRFTYLMIHVDGQPSLSALTFYKRVKETLALDPDSSDSEKYLSALADQSPGSSCHDNHVLNVPKNHESTGSQADDLNELISQINSLIGLHSIKTEVNELVNFLKVQQMRLAAGFHKPDTTNHMVFYGNPGTGKTTIARKLGEIYQSLNLLSKGHFVETDRAGLVGGYLGQTALKTREVLDSAKGGILFIDEAYTLSPPNDQDLFGQEAIDTMLKYMEDNRDDLVVIVAGYQDRMERFISSNPGLKSRFGKYFFFPDYSATELSYIFGDIASKSKYSFGPEFKDRLEGICDQIVSKKNENFGNGRVMRNLFDKVISNHANRVIQIQDVSSSQLTELIPEDLCDGDVLSVIM